MTNPRKNKTNRKNNTNLVVNWPTSGHFTHDDLHAINPKFSAMITLRTRVNDALSEGKVAEIGSIHNGKGRPKKAYCMSPVSAEMLEAAKASGIVLNETYYTVPVAKVANVANIIPEKSELVNPFTPKQVPVSHSMIYNNEVK